MAEDPGQEREPVTETAPSLSAAARRERLAELAAALGEEAVIEGDKVIVETGEPVAHYARIETGGAVTLTWWQTASTSAGHPRWRYAAAQILQAGESIHTSALGGGFLVEIERRVESISAAVELSRDPRPFERVRELVGAFPEALAALPPEPVPDYLLPDRELS